MLSFCDLSTSQPNLMILNLDFSNYTEKSIYENGFSLFFLE